MRDIFIEFNGTQFLFRTDVREIAEHMLESHAAMVVPHGVELVGRLEVFHSSVGYACHGLEFLDFPGEAFRLFDWLSRDILEQFMRRHSDLLWLHAGVVSRRGQALLIVGPSAQGKSTLVTGLVDCGWSFLSDEMAPIRMDTNEVLPYPRTPIRRLDPGSAIEGGVSGVLEREACYLSPESVCRSPSTVRLVVFPRFSYGSVARLRAMTPGESSLELARNCTNFSEHRGAAVTKVASLALGTPAKALDYGDGFNGVRVLDDLALSTFKLSTFKVDVSSAG